MEVDVGWLLHRAHVDRCKVFDGYAFASAVSVTHAYLTPNLFSFSRAGSIHKLLHQLLVE